jgi:hypothetical protein
MFDLVDGLVGIGGDLFEAHPDQDGTSDVIADDAGLATLAAFQAGELLRFAMKLLNGTITNDKFCVTQWGELQLSWWRRPLRLRQSPA